MFLSFLTFMAIASSSFVPLIVMCFSACQLMGANKYLTAAEDLMHQPMLTELRVASTSGTGLEAQNALNEDWDSDVDLDKELAEVSPPIAAMIKRTLSKECEVPKNENADAQTAADELIRCFGEGLHP